MRNTLRITRLAALIGLALAAPAFAADDATTLPKVNVNGSKPTVKLDTPGIISTITREQIDRYMVQNIRDLVRYEPGVSVIGSPGRFGLDSFNIRGLSGNRSVMEVDGVSLPASFGAGVAGSSFRAGRNQIDMDDIKQAEIIRGPVSALYPSDALGGAVILTTKDPLDYLKPGDSFGGQVKATYDGSDNSKGAVATIAFGNQRNSVLLQASYRKGDGTENQGTVGGSGASRTKPDPLTYKQNGVLAKYVHNADSGRRDFIGIESARTDTHTDSLTALTSTQDYYLSQDANQRFKFDLGQSYHDLGSALADTLDWTAYWQKTRSLTNTQTDTATVYRYYESLPDQEKTFGGKLLLTKHWGEGSGVDQLLSYGLEVSRVTAQSYAGGYGVNKTTGASGSSSPFLPGNYPLHMFPTSDTDRYSLFAQDKIDLVDARLSIVPGIRLDQYGYSPRYDAVYYAQTNSPQTSYNTTHGSPKLGINWKFNDSLSAYFNYASGFRPPLYNELDGAWGEHASTAYYSYNIAYAPNPDLKAETSKSGEIGLRGQGSAGWFNLDGYYSYYDNFIWSGYALAPSQIPSWVYGLLPGADESATQAFQSVNTKHAIIKGVEASGNLQLGYFNDVLAGWSINASASISKGLLIQPGDTYYTPLNTVDPAKAVVGIAYDTATWGTELVGTGVRRHTALSSSTYFRPPGYGKLDLFAHYRPTDSLEVDVGLQNLTDRKYWDWGNLQGGNLGNLVTGNGLNDATRDSSSMDLYTMPGRYVTASVRYTF